MGRRVLAPKHRARLQCVPPAMLRDPGETLEGDGVLAESSGDLALLLWRTARDVALWGSAPPAVRGKLFSGESANSRLGLLTATEIPAAISGAVDTLHGMLAPSRRADTEIVAVCCLEVAAWARRRGLPHTAIAFAQAGAVAAPAFGEAALHVGIHARAAGQGVRAETWLRRAVAVSRRERARVPYSVALVELGELYEGRGKLDLAERFHLWGFRAARRFATRNVRMRAAHGLFRLMRRRGDDASATRFALTAQRLYGTDAAGGPALLLDLARYWTDHGEPARARGALRRLVASLPGLSRADQLAALALTARARTESGNRQAGARVARAAWTLMADEGIADTARFHAARDLAHAALLAGDPVRFTQAKRAVLRFASQTEFPVVAAEMARMWPGGERPPLERAS